MTMEECCEKAINEGLSGIMFTDHLDFDFPGYENDYLIDYDELSVSINRIRDMYGSVIKIGFGIEAGYQYHTNSKTEEYINSHINGYDLIINSVHIINGRDPYLSEYYENRGIKEVYGVTLENISESLDNFGVYDVVGHIEFITRNAPYNDRTLLYSDYSDIIDIILNKLVQKGKGIELNTGNLRLMNNISGKFGFDKALYRRYRELGGEIITIGSDAHKTSHISHKNYIYALEFIKDCGFKYYTWFEKRKPIFLKIETV